MPVQSRPEIPLEDKVGLVIVTLVLVISNGSVLRQKFGDGKGLLLMSSPGEKWYDHFIRLVWYVCMATLARESMSFEIFE